MNKSHEFSDDPDQEECTVGHSSRVQCRRCIHCGQFIRPYDTNEDCPARDRKLKSYETK